MRIVTSEDYSKNNTLWIKSIGSGCGGQGIFGGRGGHGRGGHGHGGFGRV